MTAQIHERLILDGAETSMAFCPPLPDGHPRIFDPRTDDIERKRAFLITKRTDCWRGYQGTWEIRDGRFYLVDLRGQYRLRQGEPILADWFTGVLRVPRGEQLLYVHMGFGTVYEEEMHITIERGRVVGTKIIDNRGKEHDRWVITWDNLPGGENRFPGDKEL